MPDEAKETARLILSLVEVEGDCAYAASMLADHVLAMECDSPLYMRVEVEAVLTALKDAQRWHALMGARATQDAQALQSEADGLLEAIGPGGPP